MRAEPAEQRREYENLAQRLKDYLIVFCWFCLFVHVFHFILALVFMLECMQELELQRFLLILCHSKAAS